MPPKVWYALSLAEEDCSVRLQNWTLNSLLFQALPMYIYIYM